MGINNRQRRAANKRERARANPTTRSGPDSGAGSDERESAAVGAARTALRRALLAVQADPGAAGEQARLLRTDAAVAGPALVACVAELAGTVVASVVASGWTPTDLHEILRRRLGGRHRAVLAGLLATEAQRHPLDRVTDQWREQLAALGMGVMPDLGAPEGLAAALGVLAALAKLPVIATLSAPPGAAGSAAPAAPAGRALAKVRALLAKAESTTFEHEAQALTAKAQELISRYALERLLAQPGPDSSDRGHAGAAIGRRIWIDAPYVLAKATLIHAVATTNGCRSVLSRDLGFTTVIGEPGDLDDVELLATSLLLQAMNALHGNDRQFGPVGRTARTRSFRQSFFLAYASRIGERLGQAAADAAVAVGRPGEVVPLLAERDARVAEAADAMFPDLVSRAAAVTNGRGWAAGRAAADLALVDLREAVTCA